MNILEEIIDRKKWEVAQAKNKVPLTELENSDFFNRKTLSLKKFLLDDSRTGIIAEFKRKSPSKGIFNATAKPEIITRAFTLHGASGLSVLTDEFFFAGSLNDLRKARVNDVPILRKDFIIDEYQITEAKSIGADVILLIAACLSPKRVEVLSAHAKRMGLEVLLEIHDGSELGHICEDVDLVGVNNRDLKTFKVDVNRSVQLSDQISGDKLKISESGISDIATILMLKENGFKGFLIGETFMKEPDPSIAFASFAEKLKLAQHAS